MELGKQPIQVISLDDLIAIKRHLGRPKDKTMLLQLEELKRLQEREDETTQ